MAYYVKNLNDYCEKCVAENVSMFQGSERWGLLVNSSAGTVMIVDTERGLSWAAHCHEDDEFDFNIGFTYAYHRMKGWDLPEEKKKPKVRIGKLGTLDTFVYCGHKFRFLGYTKDGNFVNAEMIGYEGKYATFSVNEEVEKYKKWGWVRNSLSLLFCCLGLSFIIKKIDLSFLKGLIIFI